MTTAEQGEPAGDPGRHLKVRRGSAGRKQFEEFCNGSYARLVATLAYVLGEEELAADVVNEALARAWLQLRKGTEIDCLEAWTRRVALNLAKNQFRHRDVERKYRPQFAQTETDHRRDEALAAEMDLHAALAKLPELQRTIVVLFYFCDLSVNEIADELEISVNAAKVRLHRARAALAEMLGDAHRLTEASCG